MNGNIIQLVCSFYLFLWLPESLVYLLSLLAFPLATFSLTSKSFLCHTLGACHCMAPWLLSGLYRYELLFYHDRTSMFIFSSVHSLNFKLFKRFYRYTDISGRLLKTSNYVKQPQKQLLLERSRQDLIHLTGSQCFPNSNLLEVLNAITDRQYRYVGHNRYYR